MKRIKTIFIIMTIVIALVAGICIYNNNSEIKTIKSEKQLLKIYKNEEISELSFAKKIILLPFSIFFNDNSYYTPKYYGEDIMTNDVADSYDRKSTGEVSESKDYSKTNIQVEGVDEADIIKTNGDYIYSISENNVIITNVKDPTNISIASQINMDEYIPNDLLLYNDKLIIFSTNKDKSYYNQNTLVEIYNVNDQTNPKKIKSFELNEPYYSTRCIDNKLYVFSKGYLRNKNNKIDRKYKDDYKTKEIPLKNIKYLKNNLNNIQTIIAELDLDNIGDVKVNSYLIDISNAYVSKKNIYLLDTDYGKDKINISSLFTYKGVLGLFESNEYNYDEITNIYKFEIDKNKGVSLKTKTNLKGKIFNQYSLDEKDGNLRIALESDEGTRVAILDKKLKLIGETENIAENERMYASRFIGDKAYLVTYRNTDPLFVIDLSNEKNPEVVGELKIPGYSTYLHPYDETHLIGIGMDTKEHINRDTSGKVISSWATIEGMKMCLFDISDINNPKEIAKTTIGDSRTSSAILTNPKALLFSKEKSLLAIPVNNYNEDFTVNSSTTYEEEIENYTNYNKDYISEGYFIYNINLDEGFKLKGVINHEKTKNNYYYYKQSKLLRGLYIDNDLYTVSEGNIKVNKISDLSEISSLKINNKGVGRSEK